MYAIHTTMYGGTIITNHYGVLYRRPKP